MASRIVGGTDDYRIQVDIQRLCCKLTGLSADAVVPYYVRFSNQRLFSQSPSTSDEFHIAEKIKKKLVNSGKIKEAATFVDCHRKLNVQGHLHNRGAILHLLCELSDVSSQQSQKKVSSNNLFDQGLPLHLVSTPYSNAGGSSRQAPSSLHRSHRGGGSVEGHKSHTASGGGGHHQSASSSLSGLSLSAVSHHTAGSSGISSIHGRDFRSGEPSPVPQAFVPSYLPTPAAQRGEGDVGGYRPGRGLSSSGRTLDSKGKHMIESGGALLPAQRKPLAALGDNTSQDIPESLLLKDLVYAMQGIDGKFIKMDIARQQFKIDPGAGILKGQRDEMLMISECGWLYSKIRSYVEHHSTDKAFGLVGQSFCASLRQEMTEYLRHIAVLEAQIHQDMDPGLGESVSNMTLARLRVWTFDCLKRLKFLAALVDISKGKKGGALSSSIYSYSQHGDPKIKSLISKQLTAVCQPIYTTLLRWMYDGELEDTYHEFFVASDPTVNNERLWHDKYSLRKSMIPSFISTDQASKVMLAGKSINFLRQVCEDRTPIKGRESALNLDLSQAVSMFNQHKNSDFQSMLDSVYSITSRHLLDVLQNKYKFLEHLKAMRRYLLLGQGDFIRHLMDLLEEDLAKPASNLYLHNLTGILETAIRATNAQYDDLDILKRLDVRLLDVSPGDTGWDVFSLEYRVDGPIRTVFTPECKIIYLRVFNFMWRAKRMEYVLALIWKNQTSGARLLKKIPELGAVLHQCYVISSSMVHFIKQVQYYINFEVLECAWDELLTKVDEASDLDHIIAAHQVFLDTILSRCLLNEKSTEILQLLRTLFDLIIQFQGAQGKFFDKATDEIHTRQAFDRGCKDRAAKGEWELTEELERQEKTRRAGFINSITRSTRNQLEVLFRAYRDTIDPFLAKVASHQDNSLSSLSFRLDFNQHYKVKEPRGRMSYGRAA